jgi:outer membrane protein assembly factor BamA
VETSFRNIRSETDVLLSTKSGRAYTPEGLRRGLSNLKDILERDGYQDAKVDASNLQLNDQTGEVSVSVTVNRGPRCFIRSIQEEFVGTGQSNKNRTITPNRPYSRIWLQDFQQSIKTNEYHLGFPDTTVELQALPPKAAGDETNKDLVATVKPGPQVRVGTVEFSGSKRTRQSLLGRSVRIKRGDLLDPTRAEEGRYRLARLGIFDTVDLDYHPEDEKTRDVLFKLHEAKQINVSLLTGLGSYELLRGGVDVEANNLWGGSPY